MHDPGNEADMQYSFRRIFDSAEIQLATASSGEEGLRAVTTFKPDLVIMDVRMGGMSGLDWVGFGLTIGSSWGLAHKHYWGWYFYILSSVAWGAYGIIMRSPPIVLLNLWCLWQGATGLRTWTAPAPKKEEEG